MFTQNRYSREGESSGNWRQLLYIVLIDGDLAKQCMLQFPLGVPSNFTGRLEDIKYTYIEHRKTNIFNNVLQFWKPTLPSGKSCVSCTLLDSLSRHSSEIASFCCFGFCVLKSKGVLKNKCSFLINGFKTQIYVH